MFEQSKKTTHIESERFEDLRLSEMQVGILEKKLQQLLEIACIDSGLV